MKKIMLLPILLLVSMWSYGQYCDPSFPSGCTDDHIDNFVIPSINFQHLGTGCSTAQYANYTSDSTLHIVLEAGGDYAWSTTHGYSSQHVKIWVDIDGNNIFDEATEEVDYAQSGSAQITEGEISIPAIFPPGTYRMRIATRYGFTTPTDFIPCNITGYGEAHDYTVTILPPPTCLAPSDLAATVVTMGTADISWTASTSSPSNGYEYAVTTSATPPTSGTNTANTSVQGVAISQSVENYLHVRTDCGGGDLSSWSSYLFMGPTPGQIGFLEFAGNIPINSCYGYNYSQQLFFANELATALGSDTYITKIRYYYQTAPTSTANWDNWTVYMAQTSKPEFTSNTDWIPAGQLTQVFSGSLTVPAAGNWMEIELDNGFLWDGTSNLVIAIDENIPSYNCTASFGVFNDPTQVGRTLLHYSDSVNADPTAPPAANQFYYTVNALQLEAIAPPSCFKPTALAMDVATATTADVSWTAGDTETNWNISWGTPGYTPGDSDEINTGAASTTPGFQITNLSALTPYEFYVQANCGVGDLSLWEGPFAFTTAADCSIYTLSVTANDGYVCDEGTTILTASAPVDGDDIYWYDAAVGGNFVGNGTSFETPFVAQTTSFWATEVVLDGVIHTGQGDLSVTGLSNSTTNGGITFNLTETISILNFEARSTSAAGGAITYALIDVDNGNSVLMTHNDVLPPGGSTSSPELYTVDLNFMNIPPGNYRLIKQSGAASGYKTGSFPYPLGTAGEITTGASSATSTSTLYYQFFNLTIDQSEVLCSSNREEATAIVVDVEGVDVSATATSVNIGGNTTITASSTNTNYTYAWTWDSSTGGGTGSDTGANITVTPSAHTTYTVTATDSVTGCVVTDEIEILVFDTTLCLPLDITATSGAYVCDEGTATLTATANGTGDGIYWYDAAVGGNKVGSGASFETPFLTQTTSYWASEVLLEGGAVSGQGKPIYTVSTAGYGQTAGVEFQATEAFTVVDVEVFADASGTIPSIQLQDSNGNMLDEVTSISVPTGGTSANPLPLTIPLNFQVPAAGQYRLMLVGTTAPNLKRDSSGNTYNYPLGTVGEITGGRLGTGTSASYYFFYNWTVSTAILLCESDREEAIATVVEVEVVDVSATDTQIMPNTSTTLTATSTNTNYVYTWEPAASIQGSNGGTTVTTANLSAHTTFTVTATDSVTGCVATDEIEILVFDTTLCNLLDITATTDAYICDEGTATLTATGNANGADNEIYWYDAAVGGNRVGTGASFETPFLTQTTSYWAAEVLEEGDLFTGVGIVTLPTSGTNSTVNYGMEFTVTEPVTIVSVDVLSTATGGDLSIALYDKNDLVVGNHIAYHTEAITAGDYHTIPLNFDIPAAGTYRLVRAAQSVTIALRSNNTTGVTNPYPIGTIGQIEGGHSSLTGTATNSQYMFYNWTFSSAFSLCESDREEATATVVDVESVDVSATATSVNLGGNTDLTASSTNTNYTYAWAWDSSTGGGTGSATGATINVSPTAHTTYTVTATDSVTGCVATNEIEILVFDTTLCLSLDITSTTGDAACVGGTATLTATAAGITGDEVYWYDAAVGGNLVGKGASFETPALTQTTSYWAAEVLEDGGTTTGAARPLPTSTGTGYSSGNLEYGVVFDAYEAFAINTVDIYSTDTSNTGEITLELEDNTGTVIQTVGPISIPVGTGNYPAATAVPITVNINVPAAGTGYRLYAKDLDVPLVRESSGGNNPHPIGMVGEVTAGWASGSVSATTYYYFYNWTISTAFPLCESDREEAVATIHDIDVVASATAICSTGGSSTLTASSATNPNFTYTWNPGNLTGASITVTPTQTTTYTVTAEDTVLNCTVVKEVTIFVDDAAVVTVDPDDEIACMGSILELNSEVTGVTGELTEDFEGATNWTTVNNSTGGSNPTATAWQAVSSPYTVSSQTLSSNDASTFFITNSDVGGSGISTDTQLISPSFSLATATTASLSFYHYHRLAGSTVASVQVSVDGGITYTDLASYTTAQGSQSAFDHVTLSMDSYVGNSDVKVRFRYTGGWGYYWAIDNIAISGVSLGTTWSPMADLYLDENATVPYAGEATNTVYFSATTAGMATYTASFTNGCGTVTADAEITVPSDAAPVGPANQNFVLGETLANLDVTGTNLTWYEDAAGTLVILDNTPLVDAETYYVSQTINGCESQLLAITVTEVLPCDAPTNVVLVNVGTATAEFSWTASPDETNGYNWAVMEDGDDPLTDTPVDSGTTATGITTATATGLDDDTDYDFYVQTDCGSTNVSTWEGPLNFKTDEDVTVSNTWEVNVTDTGFGDEVSWELRDSNNTILLSGGNYGLGYSDTQTVTTSNEPLTFYISAFGPFNDNTPAYTVSCSGTVVVAGALLGGDDATHTGLVCGAAPTCPDPSAIVISNITDSGAVVSWTENGTATQWEIEYGATGFTQGTGTVVNDNDGTLGETLSGLLSNTGYDVYVRAICSTTNASAWIGPETFTTLAASCPDPSAIVISNITDSGATVSWTENGTATQWEIEYGATGFTQGTGTVVNDNDGTLGETLSGLLSNTGYDVYVRAICSTTNASAWIGPETFTTLAASCPAPSAIAISNITENSAEVSWTENGTATEWEIEYGPAGYTQGSGGTVVVDNDGTLGETLSGLADDTAYDVYVRAICSTTDTSGWAGPETFTTTTIGVNDHDFSGFTYYPNPMADVINISSQNEKYELIIFNVIGQKMITHKMEANAATLDVSHLASGSYFMQVVSDSGKTMFLKLIKE